MIKKLDMEEFDKLTLNEQTTALKISRDYLNHFLNRKDFIRNHNLPDIFRKIINVDVTLWINGSFHGSRIVFNETLYDGIILATHNASRDSRFKPTELEDINNLRIEITILGNKVNEITKKEISENKIDFTKGYVLGDGKQKGYFLPIIFNINKINSLRDIREQIATQKMGYLKSNIPNDSSLTFCNFEVQNFIENSTKQYSLSLKGPIITKENNLTDIEIAVKSANWLINNQKNNGDFYPIINNYTGAFETPQFARNTLSAWGLAEFGKTINNKKFIEGAEKFLLYANKYILEEKINVEDYFLTLSYLGQLSLSLNKNNLAILCAEKIKENINEIFFNPITFSQVSSFFTQISTISTDSDYLKFAITLTDRTLANFKKNIDDNELPYFIELSNSLVLLFKRTGNVLYKENADILLDWIMEHRLQSGSFKIKKNNNFNYTRLTGKVIEVLPGLSLLSEENKIRCEKAYIEAISWMKDFQYDNENTFFVSDKNRDLFIGGFRHDYGNTDVWIDSVGHLLLGVSRNTDIKNLFCEKTSLKEEKVNVTYPLIHFPSLIQSQNKTVTGDYFLKTRFSIDKKIKSFFDKLINLFKKNFQNNNKTNEYLLNSKHLNTYLIKNKILLNVPHEQLLRYEFFENTPGFFRVNLQAVYDIKNTDGIIPKEGYSNGFSKKWSNAIGQAYGELLERYPHSIYLIKNLKYKSIKEIPLNKRIDLNNLVRFSKEQISKNKNLSWDENSKFYWEKIKTISTKEEKFAPAQLIYWNYTTRNEPRLCESNTSGLGGGFTFEQSALSGLYELLERDAFFLHWLSATKPERINPNTIPSSEFQEIYLESKNKGIKTIILRANTDIDIPVFFTILCDETEPGPMYVLGGGCRLDPIKAINRSLNEAWSIYFWSRNKYNGKYESVAENYKPFESKLSINSRISIWSNKAMKEKLNFFIKDEREMLNFNDINFKYPNKPKTEKEELACVVNEVENSNNNLIVYAHESKHKILEDAEYHSVRIIVPGLSTMYYNEENAPLHNKRLEKFNKKSKKNIDFINRLPHIFP